MLFDAYGGQNYLRKDITFPNEKLGETYVSFTGFFRYKFLKPHVDPDNF